jgi:hypothetical protein
MPTELPVPAHDLSEIAAVSFLARYREPTVSTYRRDPHCLWQWCADRELAPLQTRRPHIELYLRRGRARSRFRPALLTRRPVTTVDIDRSNDDGYDTNKSAVTAVDRGSLCGMSGWPSQKG